MWSVWEETSFPILDTKLHHRLKWLVRNQVIITYIIGSSDGPLISESENQAIERTILPKQNRNKVIMGLDTLSLGTVCTVYSVILHISQQAHKIIIYHEY